MLSGTSDATARPPVSSTAEWETAFHERIAQLSGSLDAATARIAELTAAHKLEVEMLSRDLRTARIEAHQLQTQLLDAEEGQLAAEDTITAQLEERHETQELRKQLAMETTAADNARERAHRLEESLVVANDMLEVTRRALATEEKRSELLSERLAKSEAALDESQMEFAVLKRDMSLRDASVAQLNDQLFEARQELEELRRRAAEERCVPSSPVVPRIRLPIASDHHGAAGLDGACETSFAFHAPLDTPGRESSAARAEHSEYQGRWNRRSSVSVSEASPSNGPRVGGAMNVSHGETPQATDRSPLLGTRAAAGGESLSPQRADATPTASRGARNRDKGCPCIVA